jgi:hypothetical protein
MKHTLPILLAYLSIANATAQIDQETAPIIQDGRTIGILTNTVGTLVRRLDVSAFSPKEKESRLPNKNNEILVTRPLLPGDQVKIFKIEDGMATILPIKDPESTIKTETPPSIIGELQTTKLTETDPIGWKNTKDTITETGKLIDIQGCIPKIEVINGILSEIFSGGRFNWYTNKNPMEFSEAHAPITTQAPEKDNSSLVALANALNYLYTKDNGKPTQVSKAFLTWAHDTYVSNATNAWNPDSFIDNNKIEEGRAFRQEDDNYNGMATAQPELPVASGKEHRINLNAALKALLQNGVCLEEEMPESSLASGNAPSATAINNASENAKNHKISIKCFHAWNDPILKYLPEVPEQAKHKVLEAAYYSFVTKEVSQGRPVIVTYLVREGKGYKKKSFLITSSTINTRGGNGLELQFLNPSGKIEQHPLYYADNKSEKTGEVPMRDYMLADCEPYEALYGMVGINGIYDYATAPRFECYSIGLENNPNTPITPDNSHGEVDFFNKAKIAAEAGDAENQYQIGMMYKNGVGISKNPQAAREWLQKSAAQGNTAAENQLKN